ncbi:MAG: hypothetical protein JSS02_31010 [Planctomycetes bacterium]|nr:hypothetical protein [Planctomycetota bacterium]
MTPLINTYAAYLIITIVTTVIVARKLRLHGLTILTDGQEQKKPLMNAFTSLVLVGFNLVTFGIISYSLNVNTLVDTAEKAIEILSQKVGLIIMIIAGVHFVLTIVFGSIRQSHHRQLEGRYR